MARSIPAIVRWRNESDDDYRVRIIKRLHDERIGRDSAEKSFRSVIAQAHGYGISIREIAKAAGYSSNSPVQNILRKRAQT